MRGSPRPWTPPQSSMGGRRTTKEAAPKAPPSSTTRTSSRPSCTHASRHPSPVVRARERARDGVAVVEDLEEGLGEGLGDVVQGQAKGRPLAALAQLHAPLAHHPFCKPPHLHTQETRKRRERTVLGEEEDLGSKGLGGVDVLPTGQLTRHGQDEWSGGRPSPCSSDPPTQHRHPHQLHVPLLHLQTPPPPDHLPTPLHYPSEQAMTRSREDAGYIRLSLTFLRVGGVGNVVAVLGRARKGGKKNRASVRVKRSVAARRKQQLTRARRPNDACCLLGRREGGGIGTGSSSVIGPRAASSLRSLPAHGDTINPD